MVCSQGIIGTPSRGKSSSVLINNEHLLRLTLCHESRGILYRTISLGRSLLCYRLDYPPHSHKRKAQRHNFIHWDNEPLLWPQRARCYLLFPVFLCIWWYVRWLQYLAQPSHLRQECAPSGSSSVSMSRMSTLSQAYSLAGDTIPHVIRSVFPNLPSVPVLSLFANRQFIIVLCTVGVSYPLSLYRDIHKLSIASSFALCGMLIIVFSVIYEGPLVSPLLKGDPSKRFSFIEPGIFQAIGVISFAFVCHHNSLLIYGSLKTPTLDRFATVTHVSTALSFVACTTMAVSGYVVFTDRTQGNILNNFSAVSVPRLSRIPSLNFRL